MLLGCALPIADVGLIPEFPIPFLHLLPAVALHAMRNPLIHELGPFLIVFRRIGPSCKYIFVGRSRFPVMAIRFRMNGQRFWHKSYFGHGPHASMNVNI